MTEDKKAAIIAHLDRISVRLKYTTSQGGRVEWDAASHRRGRSEWEETIPPERPPSTPLVPPKVTQAIVQKSDPTKVIEQSLGQIAIAAFVHGIPEEKLLEAISSVYARLRK